MSSLLAPHPSGPRHGTTLMALHCSASGPRQWEAWRALLPSTVDLVTPALIGYGDGDTWPAEATLRLEDEAERLGPLLARHPDGVHLLGHSYGGAVALELARRWPQRVRSLTLYEPVRFALLRADGPGGAWAAVRRFGAAVAAHARAQRLHEAAALFIDYWGGAGTWAGCGERRREAVAACMPKVGAEFEALFADEVAPHAWHALALPVTLLVGGQSPRPTVRIAELLAAACPRARLQRFDALGHMGPVQAPARVAAALGLSLGLGEAR